MTLITLGQHPSSRQESETTWWVTTDDLYQKPNTLEEDSRLNERLRVEPRDIRIDGVTTLKRLEKAKALVVPVNRECSHFSWR